MVASEATGRYRTFADRNERGLATSLAPIVGPLMARIATLPGRPAVAPALATGMRWSSGKPLAKAAEQPLSVAMKNCLPLRR